MAFIADKTSSFVSDSFIPDKPSVLKQIKEHPFKALLEPLPKTLGGRKPSEVIYEK